MPGFLRQSTASQSVGIGPFIDDADFKSAKTGLTIANTDIKLVVNGGASANKNSGGGTHRVNGMYGITFDATDTATVGVIDVSVVVAGALPVFDRFQVLEEAVYDALFAASAPGYVANAPVNVAQISGDSVAADNAESFFDGTGYAGTNNVIPTVTTLTGHTPQTGDAFARLGAPAGASVSDDIAAVKSETATILADTDELQTNQGNWVTATGFATAANLATVAGYLDTEIAAILADTNELQADWADGGRLDLILDARASQASVDTIDGIVDAILVDTGTTLQAELDGIQADTEDIQSRLPAALVSGRIDASVGAMASGVVTATAIASDAITAAKVAADVHQETIELAFTYNATADYAGATAGSLVKEIADNAGGSALTAADIADAVWDELIAGHAISGSTGEALAAAGASGDPWITALPGSYTAGQAGYILGTNLNATVNSRASQTSVDTIDDIVDAILVDTGTTLQAELDGIQADTENIQSRLPASLVSGRIDASVGAMAANTMTASALASDAVTEIQSGLATASALSTLQTSVNDIPTNAELATALAAADDAVLAAVGVVDGVVDSIKVVTDQFVFGVTGVVNANITYVNETLVGGTGALGDEWGPG